MRYSYKLVTQLKFKQSLFPESNFYAFDYILKDRLTGCFVYKL